MDSFNDVFEAAKEYCHEHTAEATYQCYISGLEPVSFENSNCVTLLVRNDFIRKIVSDRYTALLKEAFKAVLGFDVDVVLAIPPSQQAEGEKAPEGEITEATLPSGRYDFTFENFIRGPSNQFAFAAAQAVAANPSGAYNPLFIYGPSGLGKTHLLNAIQIEIRKNHPDYNIVYVDCEKFTNEIITAVRNNTTELFRQTYREADVLLIDDIQFIAGKEATQEEFFHTFNTLHNAGKQIVLACDRPAKEIKSLEERLRTRFEWGLTADIQPPDFETRVAIVKRKGRAFEPEPARRRGRVHRRALKAEHPPAGGRGQKAQRLLHARGHRALHRRDDDRHQGYAQRHAADPRDDREDHQRGRAHLQRHAVRHTRQKRNANVSAARQMTMYIVREITGMSMEAIGNEFGRDHSTVVYSINTMERNLQKDRHLKEMVDDITKNIRT